MEFIYRSDDPESLRLIPEQIRHERFYHDEEGYFYRSREGLKGPFEDLSSALIGLLDNAQKSGLPQYQINKLYQSVCQKVVESC